MPRRSTTASPTTKTSRAQAHGLAGAEQAHEAEHAHCARGPLPRCDQGHSEPESHCRRERHGLHWWLQCAPDVQRLPGCAIPFARVHFGAGRHE
eukprot:11209023-Lingulodinium_polyedra.AAC.1